LIINNEQLTTSNFFSRGVGETEAYGENLARFLRAGDILWLYGDLGAGKTALVRGLARGLGVTERVTSPTYTINNVYEGRITLAHYDAYRLECFEDLTGAGWDEYETGVRAAEWAERAGAGVRGILIKIYDQAQRPQIDCVRPRPSETEREISLCYLP
jgi:tRNA threonylcarbamoyladenosine biosynthesis protein TsaE